MSRRTRWGADYEKTFTPLPVVSFPEGMSTEDIDIIISKFYTIH